MNRNRVLQKRTVTFAAIALVLAIAASSAMAADGLKSIVSKIDAAEKGINNLTIEYSCVRTPCKGPRGLTPEVTQTVVKYPGFFFTETGVYVQKGNHVRLDRTYRDAVSTDQQITETIAFNGQSTRTLQDTPRAKVAKQGVVSAGRWHGLRNFFNPVLMLSATGDQKLHKELSSMGAELVPELEAVDGVPCQVVKLYKKAPSGAVLRSFKVYLDPAQDYAMVKAEKYWFNFQCLERAVQIREFTQAGNSRIPSKASCITYIRDSKSKTSYPAYEQVLTATVVDKDKKVDDAAFNLNYTKGVRVWDDIVKMGYMVAPDPPVME